LSLCASIKLSQCELRGLTLTTANGSPLTVAQLKLTWAGNGALVILLLVLPTNATSWMVQPGWCQTGGDHPSGSGKYP
jgi:hypothetical protein